MENAVGEAREIIANPENFKGKVLYGTKNFNIVKIEIDKEGECTFYEVDVQDKTKFNKATFIDVFDGHIRMFESLVDAFTNRFMMLSAELTYFNISMNDILNKKEMNNY